MTYNDPRPVSDEDQKKCDEDDDEENIPVYLPSGKLQILNREQMAGKMEEARQIILERNSGSIRRKSNVVIDSIGKVCFKLVNNANLLH